MKNNRLAIIIALSIAFCFQAFAQVLNYQKLKVPTVDGGGKVFDAAKTPIGRIDREGVIYDAAGAKVAHFDPFRNVLEDATEQNFGKSDNEGNHLLVDGKKVITWKSNHPENAGLQLCLIKNKTGDIVGTVNKVYKEYGTGALFYLVKKYVKATETVATTVTKKTVTKTSKPAAKKKVVKKTTTKKTITKKKTKK